MHQARQLLRQVWSSHDISKPHVWWGWEQTNRKRLFPKCFFWFSFPTLGSHQTPKIRICSLLKKSKQWRRSEVISDVKRLLASSMVAAPSFGSIWMMIQVTTRQAVLPTKKSKKKTPKELYKQCFYVFLALEFQRKTHKEEWIKMDVFCLFCSAFPKGIQA